MNILCLTAILLTFFTRISIAKRINTFIPTYCQPLKYNPNLNIEELSSSGNSSALVVTAYLHEGLELTDGYECYVIVRAPKQYGIVSTVKKISFHDNDTLVFQSSSNPNNVWLKSDEDYKIKEIIAEPIYEDQSSIRIKFTPSVKRSQHMAGFEVAFTSYRGVGEGVSCGEDFECGNRRCISHDLQCDGYNNCGNDADEAGCAGVSLWVILLLVALGILVVCLAIFVWYRMAQR